MAGGVSAYAAVSARVRIMYSCLLSAEELAGLSEAPDFASLNGLLKATAYGPYLETIREKDLAARAVILSLKQRLADDFQSVIHSAPGSARPVLLQLYRQFEVNNIKAVLRGIAIGSSRDSATSQWEGVRGLMFPFGPMTVLPAEAMLETRSVAAAVELLRGTPYFEVLSFAMKRYSAEQSLFPLEVALDLHYWRRLWHEARKLLGEDQSQALRIVGSLVDTNNLMWAIRYRVYQGLSEEELINYTLPFGYRVHDEDVRAVAAGADMAALLARLYPGIADANAYFDEPKKGLPRLEAELKRHVLRQCMTAFVGNPFHIGVPLAYLVLSDLEIQDLTVLVEAKSTQIPAEDFRPFLLRALPVKA